MIPLLKIYDDVTSNKVVSLGVQVVSTAYMTYNKVYIIQYYQHMEPISILISVCAGIALALIANKYLVHNERVKNENEEKSIRTTFFLITLCTTFLKQKDFLRERQYLSRIIDNSPFYIRHIFCESSCFRLSFLITNLALQALDGKTTIKFQFPIVFA